MLPRMKMSYGAAFGWLAERDPDAEVILFEDEVATSGRLEWRSNRLARAYQDQGVGPGDLVTIALPNCIEFFEACLATWKLGATPQPVSSRLPAAERAAIIELAEPSLVVGVPEAAEGSRPTLPAGFVPPPSLSDAPLPEIVSASARAMTSGGSTGRPKVIVDIRPAQCDPEQVANGMTPGGTTLVPGPLYHSGPFIVAWQALLSGGRIVVICGNPKN